MPVMSLYCDREKLLGWLKIMQSHCKVAANNAVHNKLDALLEIRIDANDIVITSNSSSKPATISFSLPVMMSNTVISASPVTFNITELVSILDAFNTQCSDIAFTINVEKQHQSIDTIEVLPADIFYPDTQDDSLNKQFSASLHVKELGSHHEFTSSVDETEGTSWQINQADIRLLNAAKAFGSECHPNDSLISLSCRRRHCTLTLASAVGHYCEINIFSVKNDADNTPTDATLSLEQVKAFVSLCNFIQKISDNLNVRTSRDCVVLFADSFTAKFELNEHTEVMSMTRSREVDASFVVDQKFTELLSTRAQGAKNRATDSVTILPAPQKEKLKLTFEIGKSQSVAVAEVRELEIQASKELNERLSRPIFTAALKLVQANSIQAQVNITGSSVQLASRDGYAFASINLLDRE